MTTNDDIKARVERARELQRTPGKWRVVWDDAERGFYIETDDQSYGAIAQVFRESDGKAIAEALELLPALAADCERLQGRVAELESRLPK